MKRSNTPWRPVQPATIDWSDSAAPFSTAFDDVYYSRDDGLEESRHVFLQGNNLPQRWLHHCRPHFCIGETGFGTGLNFLLTWQAWRALPESRPDLHYLSIEKFPLTWQDLSKALAQWPQLHELSACLLDAYPGLLAGQHRLLLDGGRVRLDLWWEDAEQALADLASQQQWLVDAWYLDGFAPSRNATMWSPQLMQGLANISQADASFSTFTAAGQVRRELDSAGFGVEKAPGYGRKRERLRGTIKHDRPPPPDFKETPWDLPETASRRPAHAVVIGAGLAGCHVAAALARRGIDVTLLDQGALAAAGSGNEQGVLYTRLSRKHSSLVDFALQSFRFAATFYRELFQSGALQTGLDGDLCGSFQQSDNTNEMSALREVLGGLEEFAQVLNAADASEVLNLQQPHGGFWYPLSGWLRPASVCRALIDNDRISLLQNCGQLSLHRDNGTWNINSDGNVLTTATCVIAATGTGTTALEQFGWLPLQSIRGQTTHLPASTAFSGLNAALCHVGYIAPTTATSHCIGATFSPGDRDPLLRSADHRFNLDKLAAAVPAWGDKLAALDIDSLDGRVGFRCASPDYLPVVGPAPDYDAFLENYSGLRQDARRTIAQHGPYHPGLYLSSAHGSRGLSSAPVTAELLASMVCGEPPPFARELCRALAPARFIIRDLCRNRI